MIGLFLVLVLGAVMVAVYSVIGALFLQLATLWVIKDKAEYVEAYKACFLATFFGMVASMACRLLVGVAFDEFSVVSIIIGLVVSFGTAVVAFARVLGLLARQAVLIALAYLAITTAFYLIVRAILHAT